MIFSFDDQYVDAHGPIRLVVTLRF
jgi:hypothetical protein